MRAYIIVDLGFGDSGKGLLTDFLVRKLDANIVVRYNGGAQAGHNVVTPDGRRHTFSQFGSGTFIPHVKTYLSRDVVIHPTALLIEGDILESKGAQNPFSRLRMSDQALVITPFHQSVNRIREMARGTSRHGSCGVGVGEAVEDSLSNPENCIRAGDLHNPSLLRQKLKLIREQKREQVISIAKENSLKSSLLSEIQIFESEDVIDAWISFVSRINELGLVASDTILQRWLHESDNVIFEGAQGVLLDADAGFHPYTTWSRCTSENAMRLIREMSPDSNAIQLGVTRSYAVRHGPGPLPTETDDLTTFISEQNTFNEWQGGVRYGWFDAVLMRYALEITGKVDLLAVTHMDVLPNLDAWKFCTGYQGYAEKNNIRIETTNGHLTRFHSSPSCSLEQRSQFTQALLKVSPILDSCVAEHSTVIHKIESLLDQRVGLISSGPSADNVQVINSSFF